MAQYDLGTGRTLILVVALLAAIVGQEFALGLILMVVFALMGKALYKERKIVRTLTALGYTPTNRKLWVGLLHGKEPILWEKKNKD